MTVRGSYGAAFVLQRSRHLPFTEEQMHSLERLCVDEREFARGEPASYLDDHLFPPKNLPKNNYFHASQLEQPEISQPAGKPLIR